jgi:predicted GNAT family N-acyltransferase
VAADEQRASRAAAPIEIRWARGDEDMRGAFALRELVFCGEQGVAREEEIDGRDADALHLVALAPDDGRVVGTLRVLLDTVRANDRARADDERERAHDGAPVAKIGRVAVQREWRRRGIALRMLSLALAAAREHGCARVRLAAQLEAVALYEHAGFAVESELFEEAGIQHVWMGQRLETSA